ncbi:hypothetical protein E2C01_006246 [Portunus trituberculatus]|uniref:Uncharacterized protein n=1 Tax=Portunus trituberculatus TaxID=210409 RepID=A0A5B7CWD5_PORTR|nr:hypothetical protein [Portunus trituberculatus]
MTTLAAPLAAQGRGKQAQQSPSPRTPSYPCLVPPAGLESGAAGTVDAADYIAAHPPQLSYSHLPLRGTDGTAAITGTA